VNNRKNETIIIFIAERKADTSVGISLKKPFEPILEINLDYNFYPLEQLGK